MSRALAAALLLVAAAAALAADRRVPADPDEILARVPRPTQVDVFAAQLAARPADLRLALGVARLRLRRARELGDGAALGAAKAALAPWLEGPEPPPEARLARARIRAAEHRFEEALADLDALRETRPEDPEVHLARAEILRTLGRLDAARAACDDLAGTARGALTVGCVASIASLREGGEEVLEALEPVIEQAGAFPAEVRAWLCAVAGEGWHARGDLERALASYRNALSLGAKDVWVHAAHADVLLDLGRAPQVVALLGREEAAGPLLVRLARAERLANVGGKVRRRARLRALDEAHALARTRGDVPHHREEALVHLHLREDPAQALVAARAGWEVQREVADLRVLLEAAAAAGDPGGATAAREWMREQGVAAPWFPAGAP